MKVQVSHRLDGELLKWATEYGERLGSSRSAVVEEGLRQLRESAQGGVHDLPPAESTQDLRTPVGDGIAVKPLGHVPPEERQEDPRAARHRRLAREMGWSA